MPKGHSIYDKSGPSRAKALGQHFQGHETRVSRYFDSEQPETF